MNQIIQFGEKVPGYEIPVLNEREIRASAGMLFLLMFVSVTFIEFKGDYLVLKYFIILFITDFTIRILVNPKYSPTLIIGRLIVSRQNPEYVGAVQKRFSWIIGLVLATIMFILMVVLNSRSIVSSAICVICLVFLFFESAFGICLGCFLYRWVYGQKAQYCPGEICDAKSNKDIQQTSFAQIGIALGFIVYILLVVYFLHSYLGAKPENLWDILQAER